MSAPVYVVDDDPGVRDALRQILELAGYPVQAFADGPSFLAACEHMDAGCVLLDLAMPGMDGHEVHAALNARGFRLPILFLTGHGDVPAAVRAMKHGALDFLQKPVTAPQLLEFVRRAQEASAEAQAVAEGALEARRRRDTLTPRELEVMDLMLQGLSSKEMARGLDLSPRTVEVHRRSVMHKMGATNLVELTRMAAHLED